jgi:hypothetical protein
VETWVARRAHRKTFQNLAGVICAYGLDEASQRTAALAGRITFRGRLSVPSPFPEQVIRQTFPAAMGYNRMNE